MRPGWRTTEFWVSTALTIYGLVASSGVLSQGQLDKVDKILALAVSILSSLGYIASRTIVKRIAPVVAPGEAEDAPRREPSPAVPAPPPDSPDAASSEVITVHPDTEVVVTVRPARDVRRPRLYIENEGMVTIEGIAIADDRIVMGPIPAGVFKSGKILPVVTTPERPVRVTVKNIGSADASVWAGIVESEED